MSPTRRRTRVMYHLPADPVATDLPESRAYAEALGNIQSMEQIIPGYSESQAHGFWRAPNGRVYFDSVRVVSVDYDDRGEMAVFLDQVVKEVREMIQKTYADYGAPQEVIYVLAQDLLMYE